MGSGPSNCKFVDYHPSGANTSELRDDFDDFMRRNRLTCDVNTDVQTKMRELAKSLLEGSAQYRELQDDPFFQKYVQEYNVLSEKSASEQRGEKIALMDLAKNKQLACQMKKSDQEFPLDDVKRGLVLATMLRDHPGDHPFVNVACEFIADDISAKAFVKGYKRALDSILAKETDQFDPAVDRARFIAGETYPDLDTKGLLRQSSALMVMGGGLSPRTIIVVLILLLIIILMVYLFMPMDKPILSYVPAIWK